MAIFVILDCKTENIHRIRKHNNTRYGNFPGTNVIALKVPQDSKSRNKFILLRRN